MIHGRKSPISRALVTGGSGFIGSWLIDALTARGVEVLNVDLVPESKPSKAHTEICDIEDESCLRAICTAFRPDTVFHLAAFATVGQVSHDDLSSIWQGTPAVMRAAAAAGANAVINVSTQLVSAPYTGGGPYTPYGCAKLEAERWIDENEIVPRVVHARPTNIWGPRHPSFRDTIWRYLARRWYIHPHGIHAKRTYGYVGNSVDQIARLGEALACGEPVERVYYIGDETIDSATWLDTFATALTGRPTRRMPYWLLKTAAETGALLSPFGIKFPLTRERLQRMTVDYLTPLENTLMFCGPPRFSLEEGVAETVQWLCEEGVVSARKCIC